MSEEKLPDYVRAVLYAITCTHPDSGGKKYVGRTRTHVLNHRSYRLFGCEKRWDQHVSEAMKDASSRQSRKLNNAIRKYGRRHFSVESLGTCSVERAGLFEQLFIRKFDSIKNGYNILEGGKITILNAESKAMISESLKAHYADPRAQKAHSMAHTEKSDIRRIEEFSQMPVTRIQISKYHPGFWAYTLVVTIDGQSQKRRSTVGGKRCSQEEAYERICFIAESIADGKEGIVEDLNQ